MQHLVFLNKFCRRSLPELPAQQLPQLMVVAEMTAVTDEVFERFYLPTLRILHQISREAFDSNLQRITTVLRLRKGVILPPVADPSMVAERKDRWTYAVFLAACFRGLEPLLSEENRHDLGKPPSLLLEQREILALVPPEGHRWLQAEPDLWSEWLNSIEGKSSGTGEIHRLVAAAATCCGKVGRRPLSPDYQTKGSNQCVNQKREETHFLMSMGAPADKGGNQKEDQEYRGNGPESNRTIQKKIQDDKFLNWLREEIDAGLVSVDKPDGLVFRINEGLLLKSPEIFRRFGESVGEEWNRVQNRFLRRKHHIKNIDGCNFHRVEVNGEIIQGVLLPDDPSFLDFLGFNCKPNPNCA